MPESLAHLLDLLVPAACAACGAPLPRGRRDLCAACRRALPWAADPCPRCGLPRPCGRRCPAARAAFDGAWAPLLHEGPARALVLALKHRGHLPLAGLMAAHVVAGAPDGLLVDGAVLVPVPADPVRRRRRGLDHAGALARAIGARSGVPVSPVLRRAPVARQAGRSRAARLAAGGDAAIRVRGAAPLRVVLVDDVHTTGATLEACARALRAAGAGQVHAVTYTRAPRS